jgi:hypothetical protein
LPPELFVGRHEERREIEAPSGACLVYGGRQLGKTALLREIERSHRKVDDRITFWIDLNGLGIDPDGGRPLTTVWEEIGRQLGTRGIREATLGVPQLRTGVEKWLKDRGGKGRILVLLDEADTFVEADGKTDFQQLRLMKGLMDNTEQRFKVVFTGLHNVQRASHQVNTPLAHLGVPVCIGPLHGREEAREAWRLVTEPLSARGFTFDPPDLPMAILARANYYPSLIQLICEKLLDALDRRERVPPHAIAEAELREVLDDRDLRKLLQDRFLRTLGLDPRYHLFALCLAQRALDEPSDPRLIGGFEPSWFIEQAQEYWPDGFPDGPQPPVVRTLLEEMVGLGVLAETRSGGFVLRSPSLRPLLGGRSAISDALVAFIGRPAPTPYAPGTFRRRLGGDEADPRRSPLSMDDEGVVFTREHGAVVIGGLELAGIERLSEALEQACPAQGARVVTLPSTTSILDEVALRRVIQDSFRNAPPGVTVVLVHPEARWSSSIPIIAAGLLAERRERDKHLRIVFPADAKAAWDWRDASRRAVGQAAPRVREISLLPWPGETLRRWAEEAGLAGGRDDVRRARLRDASGGFGMALELLAVALPGASDDLNVLCVGLLTHGDHMPLGDWPGSPHRALRTMALLLRDGEDFDADLVAAEAALPRDEAVRALDWADWLGVTEGTVPGRYQLNSLVARLLAQPSP